MYFSEYISLTNSKQKVIVTEIDLNIFKCKNNIFLYRNKASSKKCILSAFQVFYVPHKGLQFSWDHVYIGY